MNSYKILNKQTFSSGKYSIVPIRMEDRYAIMKWRNEQIYHLRQHKILTKVDQDKYFDTTVDRLFKIDHPDQILFSYLENGICIGYGGLVHINWIDKNAEISFLINTELENDSFLEHWTFFLELIEDVAFDELRFHKIFTHAFDIRPLLYEALKRAMFREEARLKEHCLFDNKFIDVVIHSKINNLC